MLSKRERRAKSAAVEAVYKRRVDSVRLLIERAGGQSALGRLLGVSGAYVNQIAGVNPVRSISETTARDIEVRLGLSGGELDQV